MLFISPSRRRLGSLLSLQILVAVALPAFGQLYYVAPAGNDANPGTIGKPFASLQRAQAALRQKRGTVYLRGGTYYLPETLIFTARDSGAKDAPVVFQPYQNEHAVLSGGIKLENLVWEPWTNGICSIYDMPRAGINIGDGCWGGHVIECCDVFDTQFVNPAQGDYRVKEGSPALSLGFVNFPMDRFGVQRPALKARARTPVLPDQKPVAARARDITPRSWLGAGVRNVADAGEMSALGLPGVTGVLVLEVPADSVLATCGLQKGDVILSVDGSKTADVGALLQQAPALADFQSMALVVSRQQKEITLNLKR